MANYLVDKLYAQVDKYHDHDFCGFKGPEEKHWSYSTWAEFLDTVELAACALMKLGAEESSKAVICSPNRPEAFAAEFACFFHRICVVPVYAYCSQKQFDFIIGNSGARIIFAGAREQYKMARHYADAHKGAVDRIVLLCESAGVLYDDDVMTLSWEEFLRLDAGKRSLQDVRVRTERGCGSDMASLIYTSGTTGDPKGVILTHSNFEAAICEHLKRLPEIRDFELSMSFLPISHVFEKAWTFFCMVKGLRIAFNYNPHKIEEALQEVHPNLMCCVPRFWEKIYTQTVHYIYGLGRMKRLMVNRAMAVGAKVNLHYRRLGLPVPYLVQKEYDMWDRTLFAKVREKIGITNPNFFPTAGAALSDKICGFMRKMGIKLIYGYGMTETTATVSCYPDFDFEIGTVGTPMPMVDVRVSDDGEILVKGPTVTPGYYNNPEANKQSFTQDGFLCTGDVGYLNGYGALVLTHRKKELFKTSNGKYISPQYTEALLAADPYVEQVAVIGEGRKYVSALIVPNFVNLREWAASNGVMSPNEESLCSNPKVIEFYLNRVHDHQRGQASFEHIKKLTLLTKPFTQESGEITSTLKLRRPVIEKKYEAQIEAMYPHEYLHDAPVFNNRHR